MSCHIVSIVSSSGSFELKTRLKKKIKNNTQATVGEERIVVACVGSGLFFLTVSFDEVLSSTFFIPRFKSLPAVDTTTSRYNSNNVVVHVAWVAHEQERVEIEKVFVASRNGLEFFPKLAVLRLPKHECVHVSHVEWRVT